MLSQDSTYQFKFVRLPLIFNNGSKCDVILLIDERQYIHDYRVFWKEVYITNITTASHFESKPSGFEFREKLLKNLGFKHEPNIAINVRKKYFGPLNEKQLKIMNDMFFNDWIGYTFAKIAYALTGSNTSGEGNPRQAEYHTTFSNKNKPLSIGMFLQSMKLKVVLPQLRTKSYLSLWNKNIVDQKMESFEHWTKTYGSLESEILWFNDETHKRDQWLLHKKALERQFALEKTNYEILLNRITRYRAQLSKKLKSKLIAFKNFWGFPVPKQIGFEVQYAHIKPVWLIKKEYLASEESEKDKILYQVKNINNILPLDSDTHKKFDTYQIYWNEKGELFIKKDFNKNNLRKYVVQLPKEKMIDIKPFIDEYINKVMSNKLDQYVKY